MAIRISVSRVLIAVVCATAGLAACSDTDATNVNTAANAGSTTDQFVPPNCLPLAGPRDSLPCVVNERGVFVNGSAKPGGDGTKDSPLSTLSAARARFNV